MARPTRLPSFEYKGLHRYFVTCCTRDRRLEFTDPDVVSCATRHFLEQMDRFACALLVYCFMPDHMHLLAEGTSDQADLRSAVTRPKQLSGFDFAAMRRRRLWQKGYFERVLRNDESVPDVIRYIIENPVRARLVKSPSEYTFWGSGVYSREELLEAIAEREGHRHR